MKNDQSLIISLLIILLSNPDPKIGSAYLSPKNQLKKVLFLQVLSYDIHYIIAWLFSPK